jgi:hypothetical protein
MATRQAFGRRIGAQPQTAPMSARVEPIAPSVAALFGGTPVEHAAPAAAQTESPSVDRELEEWTRARKQGFKMPWSQLSLMASLCFGIASFVLPDSVNDNVQWLLYALMAVSAYFGFKKRRQTAKV